MENERAKASIDELLRTDRSFLKLYNEHRELDLKLKEMTRRKNLTPTDEMEAKRLKKLKLSVKDRMQKILDSVDVGRA